MHFFLSLIEKKTKHGCAVLVLLQHCPKSGLPLSGTIASIPHLSNDDKFGRLFGQCEMGRCSGGSLGNLTEGMAC